MMEPKENLQAATDLAESLSWLDYCLEETMAAMGAVKEAAFNEFIPSEREKFHAVCSRAAELTTLRMLCARIGQPEKYSKWCNRC